MKIRTSNLLTTLTKTHPDSVEDCNGHLGELQEYLIRLREDLDAGIECQHSAVQCRLLGTVIQLHRLQAKYQKMRHDLGGPRYGDEFSDHDLKMLERASAMHRQLQTSVTRRKSQPPATEQKFAKRLEDLEQAGV